MNFPTGITTASAVAVTSEVEQFQVVVTVLPRPSNLKLELSSTVRTYGENFEDSEKRRFEKVAHDMGTTNSTPSYQ